MSWDGWTVQIDGGGEQYRGHATGAAPPFPQQGTLRGLARKYHLDWRLLAAVAEADGLVGQQQPGAATPSGSHKAAVASGGGGSLPATPDALDGVASSLRRQLARFAAAAVEDRIPLAVAAHHLGAGHLADAQRLAEEFGYDPLRWSGSMEGIIGLLAHPVFAARVAHGYGPGNETRDYVARVIARYRVLQERYAP